MDYKVFFQYYISALEKALSEDHINYGFLVKSPNWWYPEGMSHELEKFEEANYERYPILEHVAYYFDAKSHGFPEIEGLSIDDYRTKIINEMNLIAKEVSISGLDIDTDSNKSE